MTTTVDITLDGICAGQNHAHITAAVQGGGSQSFTYDADELVQPLSAEERRTGLLYVLRYHFRGKTKLQIRNELQAGPINMVI